MIDPGVLNPPAPDIIPPEVLLIRDKYAPYDWAFMVPVGDMSVQGKICPSTRRRLEEKYHVEVDPDYKPETFVVLKLSLENKPADATDLQP